MKKRIAATSDRAKKAAIIAANEAKEEAEEKEKKPPVVKRGRGRPPKEKPIVVVAVEEEKSDEPDVDEKSLVVEWTKDLTWSLITGIEEDEEIRDGLYPGPGAIKRTGGKPKTHFYDALGVKLFADNPAYTEILAIDPELSEAEQAKKKAEQRKLLAGKVKNKVKTLTDTARIHILEMGQTGAGLRSAAEIKPGSKLATQWDVIKDDFPWLFNMRDLIAARPNLKPVGLGNNDTPIDIDLLLRTRTDDDTSSLAPDDTEDLPTQLVDSDLLSIGSDSDDEIAAMPTLEGALKRKIKPEGKGNVKEAPPKKKTKPQTGTSAPAAAPVAAKKATNAKDRFSATVLAEEETAQRALELRTAKNKAHKDVALAKINAEKEIRLAKEQSKRADKADKAALVRLRMEQETSPMKNQSWSPIQNQRIPTRGLAYRSGSTRTSPKSCLSLRWKSHHPCLVWITSSVPRCRPMSRWSQNCLCLHLKCRSLRPN
ncbi:hypothetical protein DFH06DRAFT_1173981 [Mycena polygramma]|nr:hypothetical protein DFH06DRAFT_1173981 [Mycena polygramma]